MKKVLVLGAGLVAGPLVKYLLDDPDFSVTVADMILDQAERAVAGRPNGKARQLSVEDSKGLQAAVEASNLVVSLLPAVMHPKVASACVAAGVDLVTASYAGPAMQEFDGPARQKGIILLNEMGLDPGIDHMEAMRIIKRTHDLGGKIISFVSYCGGLPAPEANTNPFGYKFSWSPKGVLLAARNEARFLKDGREVFLPADRLFAGPEIINIHNLGAFEAYPNRDSLAYREIYGIQEARTVLRGTLRYPGWSETMKAVQDLGLLSETIGDWRGTTAAGFLRKTAGLKENENVGTAVSSRLGLDPRSRVTDRLEWLGLFDDRPLLLETGSPLDIMTALMKERLKYEKGERDMIVLQHEFLAEFPGGKREKIKSTLVDFGRPKGDSAMSRTVGYPAAIGARLILEGKIPLSGVRVPVHPEIFEPVLEELNDLGIRFVEHTGRIHG